MTLAVALATLGLSLLFGDYERAEGHLRTFYTRVSAAQFRNARASIDEAIRLWPRNARYYGWRGYVISQELPNQCSHEAPLSTLALVQVNQAVSDYQRSVELNPRDAVAHHNLGWLLHLSGHNEEARREYDQAVRLDPEMAVFHLSLALLLDETGDSPEAERHYGTALELSPSMLDSPFFRRLQTRSPERAESVARLTAARISKRLEAGKDSILQARLGKFYLHFGDLPRAAGLLERVSKDLPNLPVAWFNLGEVRRLQGDPSAAWSCYTKAQFLDGGLARATLRMAELYRNAGQQGPAIEEFRSTARKWARVRPVTAAHNNRLYGGALQTIDDLLPTTLVWYSSPCEASAAYAALAELVPHNKTYQERSQTCESLPSPHSGGNFGRESPRPEIGQDPVRSSTAAKRSIR